MTEKYLFLCSMGQNRSPTAARVARDIAKERGLDIEMSYGAVDVGELSVETEELRKHLEKYSKIFVMEKRMYDERLKKWGVQRNKVIVLHIPDIYSRNDSELVKLLRNSLKIRGEIGQA